MNISEMKAEQHKLPTKADYEPGDHVITADGLKGEVVSKTQMGPFEGYSVQVGEEPLPRLYSDKGIAGLDPDFERSGLDNLIKDALNREAQRMADSGQLDAPMSDALKAKLDTFAADKAISTDAIQHNTPGIER